MLQRRTQSLSHLTSEHLPWNYWKLEPILHNLLKIDTSRHAILRQSIFYSYTIKRQEVNDIGEVRRQAHQFEYLAHFHFIKPINIINNGYDRMVKTPERFSDPLFLRCNADTT
ncbi:hypothetical protein HMPREF2883_10275 [Actinomyces sp. HMSC075C01]|nr:hypothetical protein HMPREF2883_10275 [Actinomyces sp. HMSC075C01]